MTVLERVESTHPDVRPVLVVMALTLASAAALLLWGLASSQAFVVMLSVSIVAVAAMGWFLERAGIKQKVRG